MTNAQHRRRKYIERDRRLFGLTYKQALHNWRVASRRYYERNSDVGTG